MKKLLFIVFACFSCAVYAKASCVKINSLSDLSSIIKNDECYEVQNSSALDKDLTIIGKLILKRGGTYNISNHTIELQGGQLIGRGDIVLKSSIINLNSTSKMFSQGSLTMSKQSQININSNSLFRNQSKLDAQDSSFTNIAASLVNASTMSLKGSTINIQNGNFENIGQFDLYSSNLSLQLESIFKNISRFNTDEQSIIYFIGNSKFINVKNADLNCKTFFDEQSVLVNDGILNFKKLSDISLQKQSTLVNNHAISSYGRLIIKDYAQLKNNNSIIFRKDSKTLMQGSANIINKGQINKQGSFVIIDNAKVIEQNSNNKN